MCSILTKGSTCRKNKKLRSFLILIEQVMTNLLKKNSVLAQIFTKLWSIYELHNFINHAYYLHNYQKKKIVYSLDF